jgi:hypothetical protein
LKGSWENPNSDAKSFQIYLNTVGTTSEIERSWTQLADPNQLIQTFVLTQDSNIGNFSRQFRSQFTGKVKTTFLNGTTIGVPFTTPEYVDPVCLASTSTPIVTSINNGILVTWQDSATQIGTYRESNVYLSEIPAPYSWKLRYTGFGPALITLTTLANVYVKVKHLSFSGCESIDSTVVQGKAFDPITFNRTPPNPVINPSATWSGKDLIISFRMPANNLPTHIKVYLSSSGTLRHFEKAVSGAAASTQTSVRITRDEFIDSYGFYPSTFAIGYVTNIDIYRNENKTQVPITGL